MNLLNNIINKKNLIKALILSFCLSMTSVFYDTVLFFDNLALYYGIVVLFYLAFWFSVVIMGRYLTILMVIINFIFFIVFKEFYRINLEPLTVYSFLQNYNEGIAAGFKNISYFFDWQFFVGLMLLVMNIYAILKLYVKSNFFIAVLCVINLANGLQYLIYDKYDNEILLKHGSFLQAYNKGMLYKMSFPIQLFLNEKQYEIIKISKAGNAQIIENYKKNSEKLDFEPKHIYLIQIESFTDEILFKKNSMTFLMNIKTQYQSVLINHMHKIGSANSDFQMLSGVIIEANIPYVIYNQFEPFELSKIKFLPQQLKEKGYTSYFYHNYEGNFYNRLEHVQNMGFDEIYFLDDYPEHLEKGVWGVYDEYMLDFIGTKTAEKTFNYIITCTTHSPYLEDESMNEVIKSDTKKRQDAYLRAISHLDKGIEKLYNQAPDDSLFFIFSDHMDIFLFGSKDTPFFVLYKGDREIPQPNSPIDSFDKLTRYIHSVLSFN